MVCGMVSLLGSSACSLSLVRTIVLYTLSLVRSSTVPVMRSDNDVVLRTG